MLFDDALDLAERLRGNVYDLWRTGYANRPDALRRSADEIERDSAALVAYLRLQASESEARP